MSFRFQKLYADLVSDDGTVCIAYVAWLEVLGRRSTHAGLELYTPDGGREVLRARPLGHRIDARGVEITLDVDGGPFVLRQRSVHDAWIPSGAPAHPDLSWSVVSARSIAAASFKEDLGLGRPRQSVGRPRPSLLGVGYADWVDIRRPTRSLGLELLQWGRLHLADSTIVYNAVRRSSGEPWMRAARWTNDGPREWTGFTIRTEPEAVVLGLGGVSEGIRVERARTLHAGDPIDPQRFPGVLERMISSFITGPANEDRRLARASYGLGGAGWAVHETVSFGDALARRPTIPVPRLEASP